MLPIDTSMLAVSRSVPTQTQALLPACDHIAVSEQALSQIPAEHIEDIEIWCVPTRRAQRTT